MCAAISILCFALATFTEGRLMVGPHGIRPAIQSLMAMHQNETKWNWAWAGPRDGAPAVKLAHTSLATHARVSQEMEMQPAVKEGVPPVSNFTTKTTAKVSPSKNGTTAEAKEANGVLQMWDWIGVAGMGVGLLSLLSMDPPAQEAGFLVHNTSTNSAKNTFVAKNVITPPAKEVQHKSEAGVGLLSIMWGPSGINPTGQKVMLPVRNASTNYGKKDLVAKNGINPPAKEVEQRAGDGSISGMFAPSGSSPPAKKVEVRVKTEPKSAVPALVPKNETHPVAKEFEHNTQTGVGLLSIMFGPRSSPTKM